MEGAEEKQCVREHRSQRGNSSCLAEASLTAALVKNDRWRISRCLKRFATSAPSYYRKGAGNGRIGHQRTRLCHKTMVPREAP